MRKHGHRSTGGLRRAPIQQLGGMPMAGGAPSSQGSDAMAPNETASMPAPMPSAAPAMPAGGDPTMGQGFARGGRVGRRS